MGALGDDLTLDIGGVLFFLGTLDLDLLGLSDLDTLLGHFDLVHTLLLFSSGYVAPVTLFLQRDALLSHALFTHLSLGARVVRLVYLAEHFVHAEETVLGQASGVEVDSEGGVGCQEGCFGYVGRYEHHQEHLGTLVVEQHDRTGRDIEIEYAVETIEAEEDETGQESHEDSDVLPAETRIK